MQCYWEGMFSNIVETLKLCHECNLDKPKTRRFQHQLVRSGFAFHTVGIDVVGPFPITQGKNQWIIVAIDQLTKWIETKAVSNMSALTRATFILENIIHKHGCLQMILTNRGTNFTPYIIPRLNELMRI